MSQLDPIEAEFAIKLRGFRQVQYVGGRLAMRAACSQIGLKPPPILSTERGAPRLPEGFTGSISHKRDIAIAMVARSQHGVIGVDVETYGPERMGILKRVLTERESAEVMALSPERRWLNLVLRFSIKEAIYKAIDPWVHRYVGFHEVEVFPNLYGWGEVILSLKNNEGPFDISFHVEWVQGRIITTARIKPIIKDN